MIDRKTFAASLAQHLLSDARMVWNDIPGVNKDYPLPDVFTIEKDNLAPQPTAYKLILDKEEWRALLKSGEWQELFSVACALVFVAPVGVIPRGKLPKGCGLVHYTDPGWTTMKRPTLQERVIHPSLMLDLLIAGANQEATKAAPAVFRTYDEHRQNERLLKKFGKDIRFKIHQVEKLPKEKAQLDASKRELGALFNIEIDRWNFPDEVERHIEELKKLADESERKLKIARQLERIQKDANRYMDRVIKELEGPGYD